MRVSSCHGSPEFATLFATFEEKCVRQVVLDKCFPLKEARASASATDAQLLLRKPGFELLAFLVLIVLMCYMCLFVFVYVIVVVVVYYLSLCFIVFVYASLRTPWPAPRGTPRPRAARP